MVSRFRVWHGLLKGDKIVSKVILRKHSDNHIPLLVRLMHMKTYVGKVDNAFFEESHALEMRILS